jgi:hypothetical protein
MEQVAKKSRAGEVFPREFWYWGCRKEELVTPPAEA